jgi:hypothetical protein
MKTSMTQDTLIAFAGWMLRDFSIRPSRFVSLNILRNSSDNAGEKDLATLLFPNYRLFRVRSFLRNADNFNILSGVEESGDEGNFNYKVLFSGGGDIYIEAEEVQVVTY